MKEGRKLQQLAAELQRQLQTKRDYEADTRSLKMSVDGKTLAVGDKGEYEITDYCHGQIADRLQIPQRYYDRMRTEAPGLLMWNVSHWFTNFPETRLVRTLDGRARAFLSDRYRPLDNFDLCEVILPRLGQLECNVMSCELTETHMYIKAVTERISAEVTAGDVVQAGLIVSNSEVGAGSVKIEPLIYRLKCVNGMIAADSSIRKFHIGRGGPGDLDGAREFFRTETRQADDRAFWMKVRDTADAVLTHDSFEQIVARLKITAGEQMWGNPEKVVERVSENYQLTENEQGSVLHHLIAGGDLSQYGLANAVTRMSQDADSYHRATDLERVGGMIIELPQNRWSELNN